MKITSTDWVRTYATVPQAVRRIAELEAELEELRADYAALRRIRFEEVQSLDGSIVSEDSRA